MEIKTTFMVILAQQQSSMYFEWMKLVMDSCRRRKDKVFNVNVGYCKRIDSFSEQAHKVPSDLHVKIIKHVIKHSS